MSKTSSNRFGARFGLAAALFATLAANASAQQSPSPTDLAQAREQLNQGISLREQGNAAGALEKLLAAHALVATPITGLELGRTYVTLRKLIEARETFLSVARIPHRPEETERSAAARTECTRLAEQLRPRIPSVLVHVNAASEGSFRVSIDGDELPREALGDPRPVNPGAHDIVATATGGATSATRVDVAEGETRTVELTLEAPVRQEVQANHGSTGDSSPAGPGPERPPPRPRFTQRAIGLTTAAVGVGGLVTAGVLAVIARSKDSAAAGEAFPAKHDDSVDATHLGDAATVFVGAGAGLFALGAVLWFTGLDHDAAVGTDGRNVWLRGSF